MTDEEIIALFDGRGRVQLPIRYLRNAEEGQRLKAIAHALGYRPLLPDSLNPRDFPRIYERDDAPHARRRAEQSITRLRMGHPLLPDVEVPPPPPPAPAPPVTRWPQQPLRSRQPSEPPPPSPPRPRVPPRPPIPPPPTPPGSTV